MSKRFFRLLALFSALAMVLAACGDGGGDADTTTTEAAAEATTTEAETTTTEEMTETTEAMTETTEAMAFEPTPMAFGALLPQTGQLAAIYGALSEPIMMGVEEINAEYADLVSVDFADSGTDPNIASENVDQFLTGDYSGIFGAAASGVSTAIVDKVQTAEVAMCSGSNTAASLSAFEPYYNRTAPSDDLQAPTLGDLMIADGTTNAAVIWRNDEYGVGFGESLASYLEESGVTVSLQQGYDPQQTSFADLMEEIGASGAEALAMITFEEGGQLVLDMQGRFDGQVYIADGFVDTVTAEALGGEDNLALLDGFRGTYPSSAPENGEPTFPDRFAEFAPDTTTVFSAHFYDCLMVLTLAGQVAGSADPTVYVDEIVGVTGQPGETCSLFADCMAILEAGGEIDYDGASGPLDFQSNGQPGAGTYDLIEYADDGTRETFDQVLTEASG
jgi:ABC-type branched-subunit amino acid transport system substrate-binding protein